MDTDSIAWKALVLIMVLGTVLPDFAEARPQVLNEEEAVKVSQQFTSMLNSLEANRYPATGSVASLVFYYQFSVQVTGGLSFIGNAGGIGSPGGGALFGDVYTDDISRLYQNTVSFQFTSTPVYLSLIFFDGSSNNLGTFQSGGVSTVLGTGGGSGYWKN